VAVDREGRVAAAVSTGGVPGQIPGRVGDSPVAGAGLWADDRTVAVAATGTGEAFLRAAAAHHVHLHLRLAQAGLGAAGRSALAEVEAVGGYGGLVAVRPDGTWAALTTTPLLVRGTVGEGTAPEVRLFAGD
jgi:beta-aspartyl-peptidase (threonine type)